MDKTLGADFYKERKQIMTMADEKNYTKSKVELIDIPDNDITANNDGKTIVHLTISSRQSGLAKNATAAQTFMYVIRLPLRNVWASFLLL